MDKMLKAIDLKFSGLKPNQNSTRIFWTLVGLAVLSIFMGDIPVLGLLVGPLHTYTTAVHEMSHAIACLATGGSVSGLTIVSDGQGHGGLTYCHGGNPFIYTPAGYLGTALFGSFLLAIASYPRLAKCALFTIGTAIGVASLILMPGAVFKAGIWQALGSMVSGGLMAAALIWSALKLKPSAAHFLLLFLAVQTGLNSLTDVIYLTKLSFGLAPGAWSDASNMQQMTMIPALVWALVWALISMAMLGGTAWWTFRRSHKF